MKKVYRFYLVFFTLLILFLFGFIYSKSVYFLLAFGVVIILFEFTNVQIAIVKKTYELYIKGRINQISLSKFQSFLERFMLSDLRKAVDERKESCKNEKA